ncbi:MAG: sigma-70 family RNA polymerase sigma factor [Pseudomonadota bacterium]
MAKYIITLADKNMDESDIIEQVWINHRDKLFYFIQSRIDSYSDAEDILSQAFSKLIAQQKQKDLPSEIVPWLYRVIRNSIIDYYRTSRTTTELPTDLIQETPSVSTFETLSCCVEPMIRLLPEPYSEVLILSDIKKLKHKMIAEQRGCSINTIKSQVKRAREKLQEKLARCCVFTRSETYSLIDFHPKSKTSCKNCD